MALGIRAMETMALRSCSKRALWSCSAKVASTASSTIARARPERRLAASVNLSDRVVRSKSLTPSDVSSFWIRRVSAGCETFNCSAAR